METTEATNETEETKQDYYEKVATKIHLIGDAHLRSVLFDLLYGDEDSNHPEHPEYGK